MTPPNLTENELLEIFDSENISVSPLIQKALDQAKESHFYQKRDDESSYLEQHIYPIVADLIEYFKTLGEPIPEQVIVGALLHDVLEDDDRMTEKIFLEKFGQEIFDIVKPLTKAKEDNLSTIPADEKLKINKALIEKVRNSPFIVQIIKLADRSNNICCNINLQKTSPEKFHRYLSQTKELYIPFAREVSEYYHRKIKTTIEELKKLETP